MGWGESLWGGGLSGIASVGSGWGVETGIAPRCFVRGEAFGSDISVQELYHGLITPVGTSITSPSPSQSSPEYPPCIYRRTWPTSN